LPHGTKFTEFVTFTEANSVYSTDMGVLNKHMVSPYNTSPSI